MRKTGILLAALLTLRAAGATAATPEALRFMERGRSLFDFGRWSDARHEFLHALEELTPEDRIEREEADFYLAACAVELGRPDAGEALRGFIGRHPHSTYANDVEFSLGSLYCTRGDWQRAREHFSKTDRERLGARRREQYDVRMGYVEFTDGDYGAAYELFGRIDPRSEYADHARYYRAYIDYAEGRLTPAREGFEALRRSDAYGNLVPYYLLQIEFREGNYRYVVDHGDELIRRAVPARRAELERVVAESWFRLDGYERTLEHLRAYAAAGGEEDRDVSYLAGFALYRTARYEEAAPWLRRACGAVDALTQNASYHLADCCLRAGDKAGAMQAFALAADEGSDPAIAEDALFNYAKLQYELGGGAFNGAINLLTRYIDRYPSSPRVAEARELLVAAYYNSDDYDAAYRAIKALPHRDGELRAALQKITYFRALEAYREGDLGAAERYLAESAKEGVSAKYVALNDFWQGEIAFSRGDHARAAARYNAYLKRAPRSGREYALAWYNLGYCAFSRDDYAKAAEYFSRFLALRPDRDRYRADALCRLGDSRYAGRRFDEAVGEYDRAIALATPERHYARYQRAVTLGVLGRTEQKIASLRQILTDGEGDYTEAAAYELGRTYIAAERYADGARQLERFVEEYPSSSRRTQALSDLGLAYLNLGDRKRSLHYYDQVVGAAPGSAEAKEAMQGIREIYVSEGDADAYFDYAAKAGMESDLTALSRDSLSFAAAQKLYLDGRREAAAESLRAYVKSYPKGYHMTDALYYLSDCYLVAGDKPAAIASLTELVDRGTHRYSAQALDRLASLTFEAERYDEAASAYRRLYDVETARAAREAAMTGYVRATIAGGDGAKIEAMAADVCARSDAGVAAQRTARYAWATQLRESGRNAEALPLYETLAAEVRTREGSEAAYRLIEAQYARGERDEAEQAVYALSEREPNAYWLARSFILLGDIYADRGDDFQARATWQSVADGYSPQDDGIVKEARARIEKLNR